MIIQIDTNTLFPDGLSDEAASAIADVLFDIATQWENAHYYQIRQHHKPQQTDLFESLQPWRKKGAQ